MSGFIGKLCLEKIEFSYDRYMVCADFHYSGMVEETVPVGFTTDLTTFWIEGKHTQAAVLHDWMLAQEKQYSRKECDKTMLEAMGASGVSLLHRYLIYAALRLYAFWRRLR